MEMAFDAGRCCEAGVPLSPELLCFSEVLFGTADGVTADVNRLLILWWLWWFRSAVLVVVAFLLSACQAGWGLGR